MGLAGFDEGRGKSSERTIELRAALGYVILMAAKIYSLSREVREAAFDLKAIQRRIRDAGHRAYEWYPAQVVAQTVIDLANSPSFEERRSWNSLRLPSATFCRQDRQVAAVDAGASAA